MLIFYPEIFGRVNFLTNLKSGIDLIQSQNLTTMTKERKVLVIRLRATQMCDVCRTFFFKKTKVRELIANSD